MRDLQNSRHQVNDMPRLPADFAVPVNDCRAMHDQGRANAAFIGLRFPVAERRIGGVGPHPPNAAKGCLRPRVDVAGFHFPAIRDVASIARLRGPVKAPFARFFRTGAVV